MSDTFTDRDDAAEAFLADLPADPPQGSQFTLRIQPGHDLGPTYQAGELVTFHVDDTPTLGATWLFDNGEDVAIARGRMEGSACRLVAPRSLCPCALAAWDGSASRMC
jgi:hypothetical protein